MKEYILSEKLMNIFRDNAISYLRKMANRIETLEKKQDLTEKEFKQLQQFEILDKTLRDYFTSSEAHIENLDSEIKRLELEVIRLKKVAQFYWDCFEDETKSHIETNEIWLSRIS